jgi:phosphatidylglycerol:prolipoprotein diacylglycerol transferase
LPYMNKDGVWYQPWFLYESTANFFGFILLFFIIDRYFKWKKSGDLFFGYILFYGIVRICLEPMRQGDSSEIVGHSVNIITSVLWIVFGAGLIAYNHLFLSRFRHKKLCLICWNETIFFFIRIFTPEKRKENLRNSKCLARRSNYSREIAETLYYRGF